MVETDLIFEPFRVGDSWQDTTATVLFEVADRAFQGWDGIAKEPERGITGFADVLSADACRMAVVSD